VGKTWGIAAAAAAALVASLPNAQTVTAATASLRPDGVPTVGGLKVLAGGLHNHTTDSDGDTPSPVVAAWLKAHHDELGIDFDTLTDHSDFFPVSLTNHNSTPWKRQAGLTKTTTGDGFTLLRGFEFTNDQENHLNVIGSQNWTSRFATGDASLTMLPFYAWLTTPPIVDPTGQGLGFGGGDGIGQFNHPGDKGALNWDDYAFDAKAARQMATIEVRGEQSKSAHDLTHADAGWYWFALTKGWTVSPTMDWDWHDWAADGNLANPSPGGDCGVATFLPCQRTLVLADDNSPASILSAVRAHRTTATELPDLWATLRGPKGAWQGETVAAAPGSTVTLTVDAGSTTQSLQSVDIVSDAGIDPHAYYDGDNAPCGVDSCDPANFRADNLTPSYVAQHLKYVATNGHSTRKGKIDSAPPGAVVATVALSGHRDTKQITVQVPSAPSLRPDGKHFFYAVVHADAPPTPDAAQYPDVTARAWTGPILTAGFQGDWIAGDGHVHDDHSSDGSAIRQGIGQGSPGNVSVADQIGQAERTGLGFLPLTDHRTYDQQWDPQWTSDKLILVPGEEANGSPHANVYGASDELVDGANPAGSAAYRHVQQSVWDVHAQNGSWGVNHPDDGEMNADGSPNANASAVGVDTVEVWNRGSNPDREIDYAENRWNAGFRFGITGGSDDHFKELWAIAGPGQPTTWVFAPTKTERGVIAGMRAGHTSISAGRLAPMVTLEGDFDGDGVFEAMGGDEITAAPSAPATLRVRVRRGLGTTTSVYAAPGRSAAPVATLQATSVDQTFTVPVTTGPSWYRVEVRGPGLPAGLEYQPEQLGAALAAYRPNNALLALAAPIFVDNGTRAVATAEVPLPALAPQPADNATEAIATAGAFSGFSDVASTGFAAHVVAEQDAAGRAAVVYQRLSADGAATVGAPIELSRSSSSARFPSVGAAGHDVWVAWQDEPGAQTPHRTDIVVRHSVDDGATWGAPLRLTSDGHAQHPDVAVAADGHPTVAWSDNAAGAFDVIIQEFGVDAAPVNVSARNKRVVKGNLLDSRKARYPASLFPALAIAPDGRVAVAWTDNRYDVDPGWTGHLGGEGTDPDNWEILSSVRAPHGQWGAPADVSNDSARADRHPSLAFANDGSLIAAWDTKVLESSGVNLSLRWSRATAPDATSWTAGAPLAVDPDAMSERSRLSAGPGSSVNVAWYDSRGTDWRWSVWGATIDAIGPSAVHRITGPGNASWPAISGNLVAFSSDRNATRPQRDQTLGVFVAPF
jgi:hypothetical protein